MTGKKIDRAAFTALGAAGLYAIFLNMGMGIPACCALAFIGMALARRLSALWPRRYRASRAQAEAAVRGIAMMPDEAALSALRALTGRDALIPALRHPSSTLTADAVYQIWRGERGAEGLAIAATCPAGPDAVEAAEALGVTLIDSRALQRRVRVTGLCVPPEAPRPGLALRLRRAWRGLVGRPASLRAALYGLSLLLMYLATGALPCLLMALFTLFITGARVVERGGLWQ